MPPMGRYATYDRRENVIFSDATGVAVEAASVLDEIFDDLIRLATSLPEPVYVISCWKEVNFTDPSLADYYGRRSTELRRHVLGIVRYGADDPHTRTLIRTQMIKHRLEGARSNLYETREQAILAVRALRQGQSNE